MLQLEMLLYFQNNILYGHKTVTKSLQKMGLNESTRQAYRKL